jgi:hypothetical protein
MAKKSTERIVLMDLNVALSSNFSEMRNHAFEDFVNNHEEYRKWMTELLDPEFTILITARNIKWAIPTLKRIYDRTGWQPDLALFNDTDIDGQDAPAIKEHQMVNRVFKKFGNDTGKYHAIDSNANTRAMYKRLGLSSVHDCARGKDMWFRLPF